MLGDEPVEPPAFLLSTEDRPGTNAAASTRRSPGTNPGAEADNAGEEWFDPEAAFFFTCAGSDPN